jgi:hypothetical protein
VTQLARRIAYSSLLAACAGAYFGFHAVRHTLPDGVVRGSFPSFLVLIVLFGAVELNPAVRFHNRRFKLLILAAVGVAASIWLEGVAPLIYPQSVGDWWDVAAMAVGFATYWAFDSLVVGRYPPAQECQVSLATDFITTCVDHPPSSRTIDTYPLGA